MICYIAIGDDFEFKKEGKCQQQVIMVLYGRMVSYACYELLVTGNYFKGYDYLEMIN